MISVMDIGDFIPCARANPIHPDRVEARKGSIARLRLERKPGDQAKL
jgi:hypothetical protein